MCVFCLSGLVDPLSEKKSKGLIVLLQLYFIKCTLKSENFD